MDIEQAQIASAVSTMFAMLVVELAKKDAIDPKEIATLLEGAASGAEAGAPQLGPHRADTKIFRRAAGLIRTHSGEPSGGQKWTPELIHGGKTDEPKD